VVLVVAWLAYGPAQAAPELNVGGLYDYLEPGSSTLLKRVRNGGDSTAFVKVSVAELVYDAQGKPHEVRLDDVPQDKRDVIVSPTRLIVPARGMQAMRILYRGKRDKERYYRLRFMPVLPEQGDEFALSDREAKAYGDSLKAGVQLLTGYGTLLFVHPADVHYQTPARLEGGQLHVSNQGNATVVLDHFRQCDASGTHCDTATKHHLLPGRSREFPAQPGRLLRFELHEGKQRQDMTFNG
jgi:P pilus assembly chaperone PapD